MSKKRSSCLFKVSQIGERNQIQGEKERKKKEKFIILRNCKTNNNVLAGGIKNRNKKENEIHENSLSFDIDWTNSHKEKNFDINEINLINESQFMDNINNPYFENNIKDIQNEGKFL